MKKYRILLIIAGLAILLLSQYKLIMPFIYKVVSSDLFLVDSKDQASQLPISTPLSGIAFMHCNNYIKSELGSDVSVAFPEKPLNAWTLGNYQYLISAEVTITSDTTSTKKYVCRITYNNGDNEEGALDFENWSIIGMSGLDDL
ncbi:MAG: hypothetical protein LUQ56_07060 [Methylococcaceae bacterium]|jgi:hypothetical protein|nr:hypothetical protein [Methylococcaceae bacterium]MDD1633873.1 hypothetical protein [Methylococcaceae bacterium]MDD1637877.1 hypothetical protein [Methylococcaceae bacterium]MDD1641997.1 hypothetical protein [Methylococcaceae bacterium]